MDTVFSIPMWQVKQKLLQRIIDRHTVGVQVTVYVPVPYSDSFGLRIQHNAVLCPFVDGMEIEPERETLPVFHLPDLRIVTELITTVHKFIHLQAKALLFGQTVAFRHSLTFLIYVSYHFTYQHWILSFVITDDGASGCLLFRNA